MTIVPRTCEQCGKTFSVDASVIKHGRGKNCSPKCQYASMRRQIDLTCQTCGNSFSLKLSSYNYRVSIGETPRYCSRACAHASPEWSKHLGDSMRTSSRAQAARNKVLAKVNQNAGSPESRKTRSERFQNQLSDPEKRRRWKAGIKRRSESEQWKASPQFSKGAAHPKFRGNKTERQTAISQYAYREWRKAVFERDDYTCQKCHRRGVRLQAHHKKEWAVFPELRYEVENGETLCETCHRKIPKPK